MHVILEVIYGPNESKFGLESSWFLVIGKNMVDMWFWMLDLFSFEFGMLEAICEISILYLSLGTHGFD